MAWLAVDEDGFLFDDKDKIYICTQDEFFICGVPCIKLRYEGGAFPSANLEKVDEKLKYAKR